MADDNPLLAARRSDNDFHRGHFFLAEVADTSGNLIQITRRSAANPDSVYYPAAAGLAASVSPGDTVLVIDLGANEYVVIGEIVT